jgi:hypothetical protein
LAVFPAWNATVSAADGQLEVTVIDKDTGKPIPCRMHLLNAKGQPKKVEKTPYWNDHFVLPGKVMLKLPKGAYTFVLERGLEYLDQNGSFNLEVFADDKNQIELRRFTDMAADGWFSGDLDVRRSPIDIELLMEADDLHLGEVITWGSEKSLGKDRPPLKSKSGKTVTKAKNEKSGDKDKKEAKQEKKENDPLVLFDGDRCYQRMAGIGAVAGNEVIYHRLATPIKPPSDNTYSPSIVRDATEAKKQKDAWIEIANPASWDLPLLVALDLADSIEVLNGRLCRDKILADDLGKPRDKKLYPEPRGGATWSQEIYFRLLECGLMIPPSAGSGSGVSPNPVGYNRAYVHIDGEFSYDPWWDNLREGRVFVTNGPLLRASVQGQLPGGVFKAAKGEKLELELALTLSTREEIHYLEIVRNGQVEKTYRMDQYVEDVKNNKLPKIEFTESGWFLVRAVCDSPKTYRLAMTGPYYVHFDEKPRISKKAAQFFFDWVEERAKQANYENTEQQKEILGYFKQARAFWKQRIGEANAE